MNEKILMAEDDPAILAGVSALLKLEGYDVLEAENGTAAIELYKKAHPDLILMDVMMPLTSGYDVCREIMRSDEMTPILMLTANCHRAELFLRRMPDVLRIRRLYTKAGHLPGFCIYGLVISVREYCLEDRRSLHHSRGRLGYKESQL
jgi:CheY-like chemotaxis protein